MQGIVLTKCNLEHVICLRFLILSREGCGELRLKIMLKKGTKLYRKYDEKYYYAQDLNFSKQKIYLIGDDGGKLIYNF